MELGLFFLMKEEPAPSQSPPNKKPAKTGLTLFGLVGGFVLLIMVLGWIIVSSR